MTSFNHCTHCYYYLVPAYETPPKKTQKTRRLIHCTFLHCLANKHGLCSACKLQSWSMKSMKSKTKVKMCSWHIICSVRSIYYQHSRVSSNMFYPQYILRLYLWQCMVWYGMVCIPWAPFILLTQTRVEFHFDLCISDGCRWVHQEVHFYLSSNIGSPEEGCGVSSITASPGLCTQYRQGVSNHGQGQDVERIYNQPCYTFHCLSCLQKVASMGSSALFQQKSGCWSWKVVKWVTDLLRSWTATAWVRW